MLIIDQNGAHQDDWVTVADEDPIPPGEKVIVTPARLTNAIETIWASVPALGVHIANDTDAKTALPYFNYAQLISIAFPSFADGRGFSLARKLRWIGFVGELRATGPVIADQYAFLKSCGFDSIAPGGGVTARQGPEQWANAMQAMSFGYQRGYPGARNILEARAAAQVSTSPGA